MNLSDRIDAEYSYIGSLAPYQAYVEACNDASLMTVVIASGQEW